MSFTFQRKNRREVWVVSPQFPDTRFYIKFADSGEVYLSKPGQVSSWRTREDAEEFARKMKWKVV